MERMNKEELKKELKKLKDFKVYAFEGDVYVKAEDYKEIAIENKKLREYADNLDSENDNQAIEIEELQRENDKLKIHIEAKDKAYMDLLADYDYLKARIKKTERAFLKYEEKQEKLLGDLDMIVMNR